MVSWKILLKKILTYLDLKFIDLIVIKSLHLFTYKQMQNDVLFDNQTSNN